MEPPRVSDEDKSLGRNLVLASKIRLMLDEIAGRIATRKKDDDVIKALMVLSGIIEQDTVKGALRLYERGRVKLFGLKGTIKDQRPPVPIEDKDAELDRLIDEMEGRKKKGKVIYKLPEAKITIPARVCHGRRGMLVAQVSCSPDRFIFPEANFCCCDHFERRVLEKRYSYTCVHWLAAWLALAMGQKIEETTLASLRLMRQAVVGVREEHDELKGDRS
ncbi:hypothetical protein PENTCL1PPCAC_27158 [Pristionchus entomophagus]|uniref:SWIM-type domain-containing protein n=1 Tax=Pristionchus entomophagus TaxID=358040 RepID=A0AAV5UDD7_9BILA|nr:hypothetical protein PENTCL1PPCAC_27158 [Pristionchus entomophagus]